MVRDPLSRFASAYLDMCFVQNCTNGYCFPRTQFKPAGQNEVVPNGQPISFRHALDWILHPSTNVTKIDGHWSLQSSRCGLGNGGLDKYYSFVGRMTKATLSQDAACIMENAGIGKHNIGVSGENEPFWASGGIKSIKYRQEEEGDVLRKLFTPETARQLMKKFQQDYDTFQFPEPDWIKHATGEWIDSYDHHRCVG